MKQHLLRFIIALFAISIWGGAIFGQVSEKIVFSELCGDKTLNEIVSVDGTIYCTISFAQNDGTNPPAFNKDGTIRLYKSSSGPNGCSMTITAKDGYNITSVTYTFKSNQYNVNHSFKADDNAEIEVGQETTWSGVAKNLAIKNTSGKDGDQLRITEIDITYSVSSTITPTSITFGDYNGQTIEVIEGKENEFVSPTATLTPSEAGNITYSSDNENVQK